MKKRNLVAISQFFLVFVAKTCGFSFFGMKTFCENFNEKSSCLFSHSIFTIVVYLTRSRNSSPSEQSVNVFFCAVGVDTESLEIMHNLRNFISIKNFLDCRTINHQNQIEMS